MKKIISFITVISIILSFTICVHAENAVTADALKELLYKDNMTLSSLYSESVLNTSAFLDKDITKRIRLGDAVDPLKTFKIYDADFMELYFRGIIPTSYDDAIEKTILLQQEDSKYKIDYEYDLNYYQSFDKNDNKSIWEISLQTEKTVFNLKNLNDYLPDAVHELEKVADVINSNDIGTPTRLRPLISGQLLIDTDKGQYVITQIDETDESVSNQPIYHAWELVPSQESFDFRWKRFLKSTQEAMADGPNKDIEPYDFPQGDYIADYVNIPSKFTDIESGTTLCAAVAELSDLGAVNGYEDGTFRPDALITRAETAAMLTRLMKYGNSNISFADTQNHWAAEYIGALCASGIVDGYNGMFRPDDNITYDEIFKIVLSILGRYGAKEANDYPNSSNETAINAGLTEYLGSFTTASSVTRANLALILSSALDTNISTQSCFSISQSGVKMIGTQNDITLFEYIKGGKLHSHYFTSAEAIVEWEDSLTA